MTEQILTGEQQLIKTLLEDYIGRIKGTQPMLQRSMSIAYEAGVRDALSWVRKYNEATTAKPKPELIKQESDRCL